LLITLCSSRIVTIFTAKLQEKSELWYQQLIWFTKMLQNGPSAKGGRGPHRPGAGRFQIEKYANIIYDALAEIKNLSRRVFSQRGWAQLLGNKLKQSY
jgi:hypothetical protein